MTMAAITSTDPVQLARALDHACRRAEVYSVPADAIKPLRQLALALIDRGWTSVDQDLFEDSLAAAFASAQGREAVRDLMRVHALYLAWDRASG